MEHELFAPLNLSSANGGVMAFHWARRTFILLVLFLFFGIGAVLYPYHPLDYQYVQMETSKVKPGGVLIYKLWFKKHTDLTPIIHRKLVSVDDPTGDIAVQATTLGTAHLGEPYKRIYVGIPAWVEPRRYFVRVKVVYPYWGGNVSVDADYRTPEFEVVR